MKELMIRMADENDAEEILSVYSPYVTGSVITFEYDVPDIESFRKRVKDVLSNYPYLVCTEEGKVVGYAYASRHKERAAYQWNAELSVYVREGHHGLGIGKTLYGMLLELLRLQNVQNVYGCVTSPNIKSEGLHSRFGFEKVGTYRKTGYKFGSWLDVMWFEKNIGEHEKDPEPFTGIGKVKKEDVDRILREAII
jgi:phosphinothricin acetyltransferase